MEELTCERKMIRIQKKREKQKFAYENSKSEILAKNKRYKEEHKEKIKGKNKKYKEEHKEEIIGKNKKYHEENKSEISKRKATSYQKNRGFICQRKRFENHLQETNTRSYVTEQQQHLYYHTKDFCQPDTMEYLNHSIEYYDGICDSCGEASAIKIIGINRMVCSICKKSHCKVCRTEVSPNPLEGYLHFWPPGKTLKFIPGFCSLFSMYPANYAARNSFENKRDCRMCDETKTNHPEYESFKELVKTMETDLHGNSRKMDVMFYICSLCKTRQKFVCEFKHHMKSHTEAGNHIAIVGFNSNLNERVKRGHLKEETYAKLEKEFMKLNEVIAVLTIVWKEHMTTYFDENSFQDVRFGAALLLRPGIDIATHLSKISFDADLIENLKVVVVRPHTNLDKALSSSPDDHDRKKFHKLICWNKP